MSFVDALRCSPDKEQVALAICRGSYGHHIGIVFSDRTNGQRIIHLRWHHMLAINDYPIPNAPPLPNCWVAAILPLHPTTAKAAVGVFRHVAKKMPEIPYGVNVLASFGSFSAKGVYTQRPGSDGLTCATFVIELFRAVGIKLLAEDTWPAGVNQEWVEQVATSLQERGADAEHVEKVRANIGTIRIRPDEVAATAIEPIWKHPLEYVVASATAVKVREALGRACP